MVERERKHDSNGESHIEGELDMTTERPRASKRARMRWLALLALIFVAAAACTGDAVNSDNADGDDASSSSSDSGDSGGDDSSGSDDDSSSGDDGDDTESVDLTAQGETFEFQVQTGVPASSVYHAEIVEWGERLERMSGGRLQAEVVPSGAVVGALEILDAVDTEIVPVGMAWSNYWTGKNPTAALFSNPPVGSTGLDQSSSLAWMYDGGGLELYERLYTDEIGVNVKPLPVCPMGPDPFGWFNEPITSVADVQGLPFRSPPGLPGLTFQELGVDAIAMPGGDIVPSAQSGIIDGAEWISPADDRALGLSDVWDNYYLQGLHQSTDIGELLFNIDWWDSLPADLQEMILVATQATIVDCQNVSITVNADAVAEYQEQGINIYNTPPEFYDAFIDAWETVAADLAAEDPFFAEVRESQQAYAERVMPFRLTITELYQEIGETYFPDKVGQNP